MKLWTSEFCYLPAALWHTSHVTCEIYHTSHGLYTTRYCAQVCRYRS